jgi:hypothetical protein
LLSFSLLLPLFSPLLSFSFLLSFFPFFPFFSLPFSFFLSNFHFPLPFLHLAISMSGVARSWVHRDPSRVRVIACAPDPTSCVSLQNAAPAVHDNKAAVSSETCTVCSELANTNAGAPLLPHFGIVPPP